MISEVNEDIILLWRAFLKGDDKAFSAIYFAFIHQLLSYGHKLTDDRNIILDSVQDVFIEMYEKRGKSHPDIMNPKAYLFIALKSSIFKKLKRLQKTGEKERNSELPVEFRAEYSFQDQLISQEITEEVRRHLRNAIENLSVGQKEIIYLKFEEGLGYVEIARIMEITVESARKQLYRALTALRNTMDPKVLFNLFSVFLKKN